jgi:hypothetical protein
MTRAETVRPDMSRADFRDTLWIELRRAHRAAYELSRSASGIRRLLRARGYRDGLLTAYAMLTARSDEDVYESLQDALGD